MSRWNRAASLAISLLGACTNFAFAFQLSAVWRSLKWDTESEWEGSVDSWTVNGAGLLGGLSAAYFVTAAAASVIGFFGIVKGVPKYIRFYRDFSIADFAFCSFTTLFVTYASYHYYSVRTGICEELSRHADVMLDLAEMGVNLENCEQWFERGILAFVVVMLIIISIRLHFVIAVSNYYAQVSRHPGLPLFASLRSRQDNNLQKIYLLPSPSSATPGSSSSRTQQDARPVVYAPIPLSELSERDAQQLNAQEAWIHTDSRQSPRQHKRSQSRSQRLISSGRIGLPVRPGEGLFPSHGQEKLKD